MSNDTLKSIACEQRDSLHQILEYGICDSPLSAYCKSVPFDVERLTLYSPDDLFPCFDMDDPTSLDRCYDTVVYQHMLKTGKSTKLPFELVARGVHDMGITMALKHFLRQYDKTKVVGIMGGHGMARTCESYRKAVDVSKALTEKGYLMISGGGPGAMEATHLGAWMAERTTEEVDEAIRIVGQSPFFQSEGWMANAIRVKQRFPLLGDYKSLAIPTWFYGHEPPTVFATHIAKLFENSVREETLLAEAYGGLVFMEGSAGTLQEIFQDAVHNHYLSLDRPSPMIFVGKEFWTKEVPVVPFMEHMIQNGRYKNMYLSLVDKTSAIIDAILDFENIYSLNQMSK